MTHKMALGLSLASALSHRLLSAVPSGTLLPVAWQPVRQLAGIPHANPVATPWVGMGRVNAVSLFPLRFQVSLLPAVESKRSWFFVWAASFSGPAFSASPHQAVSRLVTASPNTPARLARCPLKPTPMQEGWRLRCFVNKATDG